MQTNYKFQSPTNQVISLDNSLKNGCSVTSLLYDSKKALNVIDDMRSYDYSPSYYQFIIEEIDDCLLSSDSFEHIVDLVHELSLLEKKFKSFKLLVKKLANREQMLTDKVEQMRLELGVAS